MNEMLHQLGVREDTLTYQEKAFLDEYGYLVLGQILTTQQLDVLRNRFQEILDAEAEKAGIELLDSKHIRHPKEEGVDRLADLVNKDPLFDIFYTYPRVLAGIAHVLGQEIKLSALNFRAALPGFGLQQLHVDWHETVAVGAYKVCNSIWLLDDFSVANGATRLVPGSHKHGVLPQGVLQDPFAPHPNEIILEARAGTVVIFNSHTWHGGTINKTDKPRRAVHSYFCQHTQPQQVDQKRYLRKDTLARISEAARALLDV